MKAANQQKSSDKPADMRPNGHTGGNLRVHHHQLRQARQHLHAKPQDEDRPCRQPEDENGREIGAYAHPGIEVQICPHYSGNGPGRTDRRNRRGRIDRDVRERRDDASHQIKGQKLPGTHAVFNVVSKHPEVQRIANDMAPTAMQKNRRNWSEPVSRLVINDAAHSGTNGDGETQRRPMGQLTRHHAPVAHTRRETLPVTSCTV